MQRHKEARWKIAIWYRDRIKIRGGHKCPPRKEQSFFRQASPQVQRISSIDFSGLLHPCPMLIVTWWPVESTATAGVPLSRGSPIRAISVPRATF
jgi:hypothetical protein